MTLTLGIRREDKSEWERRVPLIPRYVKYLHTKHGLEFIVQTSKIRVFRDGDYRKAGAVVAENLYHADIVLAVKEVPKPLIEDNKVYLFFAHVIKGQEHNMDMLRTLMDRGCTLIDYERIVDRFNRRLVFFGRHAGIAGMVETLRALGRRFMIEGVENPFDNIWQPYQYHNYAKAKAAIVQVAQRIKDDGIPKEMQPLVIGLAGYGNVSRGTQEILEVLPTIQVDPPELTHYLNNGIKDPEHNIITTIFREEHMVRPKRRKPFNLPDYYEHPKKYEGVFDHYLPVLTVLVNCIYWDDRYPRLISYEQARKMYNGKKKPKLRVIGDISCDYEGAVQMMVKATQPDHPTYVFDPQTHEIHYGVTGKGPVIMAIDNLPCEMPREASTTFSEALCPYLGDVANADFSVPFSKLKLPQEIKGAVIVHKGKLTPDYEYVKKFLRK